MAPRTGHVLLVNGQAGLLKLATAAAGATHCQLTSVAGLEPALSWVAKKQFDLILLDAASLGAPRCQYRHFGHEASLRNGRLLQGGHLVQLV